MTAYINVNFNKMLETLTFQQSYAWYLYSIHIHNQIIKSGAALVNTISINTCKKETKNLGSTVEDLIVYSRMNSLEYPTPKIIIIRTSVMS